jgi:O-antigen/teichoic acid export membrane protein
LISPVILVRLLSVEEFGRFREFLLYVSVLSAIAAFGINSSLLRFVPQRQEQQWRFVNQSTLMTLCTSTAVLLLTLVVHEVTGGTLLGEYAMPVALYVFLFVNFDHWEFLWLAQKRPIPVFAYTSGRLVARMVVVVCAAALTADVHTIIWSLVVLEAVRLVVSLFVYLSKREVSAKTADHAWREQLQFCVPYGTSLTVTTLNKWLGNLFVAKMIGPIGLAHYTIGTYVQPIITVVRNSLSDSLLPEMSGDDRNARENSLVLWRRTTVVIAIFLIAAAVVLGRSADLIITTLFSAEYRPAVALFQIYLLVLIRESVDFAVPLRAISQTTPILRSNLLALGINAALALLLLPTVGLAGAVWAFVISRMIEGIYLGWETLRAYQIRLRDLADWRDLGKVIAAALLAAPVLHPFLWGDTLTIASAVFGSLLYCVTFCLILALFRVNDFILLLRRCRRLPGLMLQRR